ncbi:MAG: hypothetical protein ACK5JI_03185 [Azonexus sp.]
MKNANALIFFMKHPIESFADYSDALRVPRMISIKNPLVAQQTIRWRVLHVRWRFLRFAPLATRPIISRSYTTH